MSVSYDRLWRLMKENKMTKRDLAQAASFSPYMMGQFTKDAYVSLKEIETLCEIFHCQIEDVVEITETN
jgi:putative transcriptional regulator